MPANARLRSIRLLVPTWIGVEASYLGLGLTGWKPILLKSRSMIVSDFQCYTTAAQVMPEVRAATIKS